MQIDPGLIAAGLLVGFLVGLTGMGGGALMTPILILLFRVQPLAAVSSDLVASLFIKPVGAAVHFRRGTVDRRILLWLTIGSVPSAFAGVFVLRWLGRSHDIQHVVQASLGIVLVVAAVAMVVREALRTRRARASTSAAEGATTIRPVATIIVGAVAGLVVGMTSVGSGSLVIVALMFLYPWLASSRVVGTNLTQAIPLVGAAALAHLLYGDFRMNVTVPIVIGAIPGVYLGARLSSRASSRFLNPILAVVLLASGFALLGVGVTNTLVFVAIVAMTGAAGWAIVRGLRSRRDRSRVALSDPA